MSSFVTVIMHDGGKLMRNEANELDYIGGEVDVWEELDSDYLSRILIIDLCKLHNYHRIDHCYWLSPEKTLEDGLRELRWDCDADVLDMCIASKRNHGEIEVFIEHPVVENPTFSKSMADLGEKEGAECFGDKENEAGEEVFVNEENVRVEETNEGGMDVPAEGEHVGDDAVENHNDLPIPEEDNGSNSGHEEVEFEIGSVSSITRKRVESSDDMMSSDETDYGTDELSDQDNDEDAQPVENFEAVAASMHIVVADEEDEEDVRSYKSEELRSPISSDDEQSSRVERPVFLQFNDGVRFGSVNLECGMEFETLVKFKQAVKDFTIHHGREIKWVKNDKVRARAKCKVDECCWEIFGSWSSVNKSFQIKTFKEEHNCARGFRNNQATTKWVTQRLVGKLREQPTLTYTEAFDYMKREYGVYLDDTKVFRSIKAARKLVMVMEIDMKCNNG